ncbi:MAG: AmmeMemoRadiSam system protein A [Candidatus Izemoplasmatales bacterium]|mgnify:CR=1 FL=1|nr:AmmeMemoRadiSam system protein A [Candidatus Izemoplasmatales bacterium]NLF48346.1 AmmeMemoRadiSam system protein A [Acholeplasmataceae bacterium]
MSINAAFVLPHPPLIIPAVGRGEQTRISKTIQAYQEVARRIKAIRPAIIILSSPHAIMYSDYIHISPGKKAQGSFSKFGAADVQITVDYDQTFVQDLCLQAKALGFPAGTLGERSPALDHGSLVPLYFINQEYTDYKLVRVSLSGLSLLSHYQLGKIIQQVAEKRSENSVFIASGDLSHKLKENGPYGFHPEGPRFDQDMTQAMENADFMRFLTCSEQCSEQAAECGHRSLVIMAGALDGRKVSAELLSYEGPFGVGYAIAAFKVIEKDSSRHFDQMVLQAEQKTLVDQKNAEDSLVRLARLALETYVLSKKTISPPSTFPQELTNERAGVFVSLKLNQRLRGCIGTTQPTTSSIAEEIIQNAISAGTHDPRFDPVSVDDLSRIVYSVDVLKPTESISSIDELDPKRYGIIVRHQHRQALLLPNLEGIDTVQEQLQVVLRKAGIKETESYTMERFEVVRHF